MGSRGFTPGFVPAALQAARKGPSVLIPGDSPWVPGFHPGLCSRGLSGRPEGAECVDSRGFTLGSRGFTPGFVPAALQAARKGPSALIPGVSPRVPGVSPRALFPRPYRPARKGPSALILGVSPRVPGVSPRALFRGSSGCPEGAECIDSRGSAWDLFPRPCRPPGIGPSALIPGFSVRARFPRRSWPRQKRFRGGSNAVEVKIEGVVDRQDQESVANLDVDGAALVEGGRDEAILFEAVRAGAPVDERGRDNRREIRES